jgi:glycyl-tRNA synthetase beta chain
MTNKFLFELGTEEIPAWMINPAMEQLRHATEELLVENELEWTKLNVYGTPRRISLIVEGLPLQGPDRLDVVTGPPKSVAFDQSGQPTKAALGFARKLGVEAKELEVVKTDKGEYLSHRKQVQGDLVFDVLRQALPTLIESITWPKNMYWRESRFRFIRPLRWYVSLWNDELIPFEFEGIGADRLTKGHRSLGAAEAEIGHVDEYVESLRSEYVLVDPEERRQRIVEGLQKTAGDLTLVKDERLLETVVHLNEYPTVLRGEFDRSYLEIPGEVLTTVMRHHQKYFSLADAGGKLAPAFLTVLNTDGDPSGGIRRGHEKVLQARLEDASFFWVTDQKQSLEERVELLRQVLFQEQLGTYHDKSERLREICACLSNDPDLDKAAQLCKADLTTEMVRELPELQGIMGGLYARNAGYSEAVWRAVYEHYQPIAFEDEVPSTENGLLLSIADRIDTIVGCFGIGIIPTGSSDPFALRRQAQGLVSILSQCRLQLPLEKLVEISQKALGPGHQSEEIRAEVRGFLERRVRFLLQKDGVPYDILNAVFAIGVETVHEACDRAKALQEIRGEPDFEALATAYKRIRNILANQDVASVSPRVELFVDNEEAELYSAWGQLQPKVLKGIETGDYLGALRAMASVRGVVDRFFDKVLVMVEEAKIRNNRLSLLNEVSNVFLLIADISEIVQEGEQNG